MRKKNICEVAVTTKMKAQNEKWRVKTKNGGSKPKKK